MALSLSEQLGYTTIRIESICNDGSTSTGTGFFYDFCVENGTRIPSIVTNKHVLSNSKIIKLTFTQADDNDNPIDTKHYNISIDSASAIIVNHADKNVDLCAIMIGHIATHFASKNQKIFVRSLNKENILTDYDKYDINALEEILMIGYPNGLWDNINNKPIFRRGITATHPKHDYCGAKEVMIDAACFPGSSGSPVFIFNQGIYKTKSGRLTSGDRLVLLGVLYAGPQHTVKGDVVIVNVPTKLTEIALSTIPNNLGIVIKAERLLELENEVIKLKNS